MFEDIISQITQTGKGSTLQGPVGKVAISDSNYHELVDYSCRAVFVDGGNAAIYVSPNCRVEYVRFCAVIYEGTKKIGIEKKEGTLLLQRKKGRIDVTGHGIEFSFSVTENDTQLQMGSELVSLERVAGLCRFILECEYLLKFEGLLVRDGPLLGRNNYEVLALQPFLERECMGVVKSHSVVSDTGLSAENVLLRKGCWAYELGRQGNVDVFMVRLANNAKHLFRLDCVGDVQKLAGYLSCLNDAVFYGYPYPLILADQLGRVSNQELSGLKMKFMVEAGNKYKDLEAASFGSNAHSILDSI